MTFDVERDPDRLTLRRPGARWLSNGFDGGYATADAAHNLTVPEGFDRTDLAAYTEERLDREPRGPTLLTGVDQAHARGARRGPVDVVATAGLSNPAALPLGTSGAAPDDEARDRQGRDDRRPGTVNLFVGTTRALDDGGLAGLLATAVEAKAATLLDAAGVPGTTTDAVVVCCDPGEDPDAFAGSATEVGSATRICVRDAVRASLASRYGAEGLPDPDDAEYGLVTEGRGRVFTPE